jgi:CheY-like chemotaxis protein
MGFRVLVIEDNVDGANMLGLVLRAYGFEVRVAYSGPDGVRAAEADPPDAVLCDIVMPEMDGYAVARRLVEVLPRRPVLVAVTACPEAFLVEPASRAGFDHYFLKPADPVEVGGLLAAYADGQQH